METPVIENETLDVEVCEVHIVTGISPSEVDGVLKMTTESCLFDSDELMIIEDMAWGCAYQEDSSTCGFIQAQVNISGTSQTVGFLCYAEILHWPGNYELFGIVVNPTYQRLGVGKALMAEMERQIMNMDGNKIYLEASEDRAFENTRLFYEANGYAMTTRFCRQFIPKDGCVVYQRTLAGDTDIHTYQ